MTEHLIHKRSSLYKDKIMCLVSYLFVLERRTSNPPLQMRRALSGGNGGCSCQVEIPKFHLTNWGVACVHEEIAIADDVPLGYYECPIYKANYTYKNTIISEVEQFIRLPLICNIPSSLFRNKNYKKEIV